MRKRIFALLMVFSYKATVYNITFHMDSKGGGPVVADSNQGDITYDVSKMTCLNTYNASYTADNKGGLKVQFHEQWGRQNSFCRKVLI